MIPSACFTAGAPGAPGSPGDSVEGAENVLLIWAACLLLMWARLLGQRELMTSGQSCTERQFCPGAAPLQSTAGLRALSAGTKDRRAQ